MLEIDMAVALRIFVEIFLMIAFCGYILCERKTFHNDSGLVFCLKLFKGSLDYGLVCLVCIIYASAVLLTDMGQPNVGLSALKKLCRVIREFNSDKSMDYAMVQEAMGGICLTMGDIQQATTYFKKSMAIYEVLFEAEPETLEEKKRDILETYAQAGVYLGRQMLELNS